MVNSHLKMLFLITCFVGVLQFVTVTANPTLPKTGTTKPTLQKTVTVGPMLSKREITNPTLSENEIANAPLSNTTDLTSTVNKEYKLYYTSQANWYNAYLTCRSDDLQLAVINSKEEQEYLSKIIAEKGLKTKKWWISGTDLASNGTFFWFSNGKLINYTNWEENQPNNQYGGGNRYQHCLQVQPTGKWNDFFCTDSLPFICERDLAPSAHEEKTV